MKQKNVLILLAGIAMVLTACGQASSSHEHSFSNEWSTNESTHWHAATCEHIELTKDMADHIDSDKDGKCDVCTYTIPVPVNHYKVTFDCTNCKALDENKKEITSVEIPVIGPYVTYNKFYFDGDGGLYKKPLESLIKVEKTNNNEEVDFEYNPLTGEIEIPIIDNLTVTASGINKTLEECTWTEINEISTSGRADEFFDIGEEKTVNLFDLNFHTNTRTKQSFTHTIRIIGFNHDKDANGNDLGITFEFENVITKGTTNPTDEYTTIWDGVYVTSGNNYDYRSSVFNNALNDETSYMDSIINRLPDDLKEVIKPADKKVGVNESKQQGKQYYEAKSFKTGEYPKLFPLAHDEMVDHDDFEAQDEGTKYQYYIDHSEQADRIKTKVGGSGEYYWLRSPDTSYSNNAWYCDDDGSLHYGYSVYNYKFAVAPAFCI